MVLVEGPSTPPTGPIGKGSSWDHFPRAVREFEANVVILHHSTTISCGYQPVIHCGVLRQSAEIIEITGRESLRTGERAKVKFRFVYFADYVLPGSTFLFREGRAKGIGKVTKVYPLPPLITTSCFG
jgi:GTPase